MNQASSLLNVAEGALDALSAISLRQAELAAQAANGVYSAAQRRALDAEAQALSAEYTRVTSSVSYNGVRLFGVTGPTSLDVQAGGHALSGRIGLGLARVTGDGTFRVGPALAAAGTNSTTTTDLNGDGRSDVIATTTNGVIAFLGNGDGTFLAPRTARTQASYPEYSVDVGDFNGDGKKDLALAAERTFVFLGNGDGTFTAPRTLSTGSNRNWVTTADMNGDGRDDVIHGDYSSGGIFVSLGNGDGSFRAGVSASVGFGLQDGDIGDVDGDGRLDVVTTRGGSGAGVYILTGNGDGTFEAPRMYGNGNPLIGTFADVDHDGRLDVIYSEAWGNETGVLIGNGDGTFKAPKRYAVGGTSFISTIGDLDDDGNVDVVATTYTPDGLRIFLGNGDGSFRTVTTLPGTSDEITGLSLADLNGDGALDLVVADPVTSSLPLYFGNTRRDMAGARLDLTTADAARRSTVAIADQSARVAAERASVGVMRARLDSTVRGLGQRVVTVSAAEARITDVDVAESAAAAVAAAVTRDAAVAVLAQAKRSPALALTLLSDGRG